MKCGFCQKSLLARRDAKWCSKRCRQTAWRIRQGARGVARSTDDSTSLRLAYADPPYPGLAKKYYAGQASYQGEVDHPALIRRLSTYDGWALSTSPRGLRLYMSQLPAEALICPWIKTHPAPDSIGPGNVHEYLIVSPGRRRRPGPPDAFVGAVAHGGDSNLMGRKPIRFCNWLFAVLGAGPNDTFEDLYPGSGIVGRAWKQFCRACRGDASPAPGRRASAVAVGLSPRAERDASPGDPGDVSLSAGAGRRQ